LIIDAKYIIIKGFLVNIHMMKISILLAINILVAASLVFASINFNNIYGQQTPQPPTGVNPQQQAAQQQAAQQQQQQQTSSQNNQTSSQNNQTSSQSGNLNIKSLLNYTNNAVVALQGDISDKDQKTAQDNLVKIQELLKQSDPNTIVLTPSEVISP
jgi:hypothetical protein